MSETADEIDFSAAGFAARARGCLASGDCTPPPEADLKTLRGDHILNPHWQPERGWFTSLRDAAVLIPVVDRGEEATVLMTLRTDDMPSHAGQVAFPGGKIEPSDETPMHAALREAEEEIALMPDLVEPLGYLPAYHTGSGYRIFPTVATVRPGFTLVPDQREVADVFEVPLSFLMNPANHEKHSRMWHGAERFFLVMPYENRFIWGVTAGIIRELYDEIYRG